jgi:uncharacterized protein with GYD domain
MLDVASNRRTEHRRGRLRLLRRRRLPRPRDSWERLIKNPEFDRAAAMRQLADSMGGTLESIYWMSGPYDGFDIIDVPDSVSAAALSVTLTSSGAFKHVETHELLSEQQMGQALEKGRDSSQVFRAPGRQA